MSTASDSAPPPGCTECNCPLCPKLHASGAPQLCACCNDPSGGELTIRLYYPEELGAVSSDDLDELLCHLQKDKCVLKYCKCTLGAPVTQPLASANDATSGGEVLSNVYYCKTVPAKYPPGSSKHTPTIIAELYFKPFESASVTDEQTECMKAAITDVIREFAKKKKHDVNFKIQILNNTRIKQVEKSNDNY